ncbi:MAG: hypothetical protein ACAI35_06175 [Candidatus Methylacidiphilales bacterium]|nr:hypothetical protein [Candidatus Methylacidiphilales bacterium]
MKCLRVCPDQWRLEFRLEEAQYLYISLHHTLETLRGPLENQSDAVQKWWKGALFSGDSAEAAQHDESLKEAAETLTEERLSWRDQRVTILQTWLDSFQNSIVRDRLVLTLTPEDLDHFLSILNTRRLTLACEFNIDQSLSDIQYEEELLRLKDRRLIMALQEMHLLAVFMERCLMALDSTSECQDYECDEHCDDAEADDEDEDLDDDDDFDDDEDDKPQDDDDDDDRGQQSPDNNQKKAV